MSVVHRSSDGRLNFKCPGCGFTHSVTDAPGRWSWNGNTQLPTFSPSVLVQGVEPMTDDEHDRLIAGEEITPRPLRCHSFVRDGRIEFLSDCTHKLAAQTVPLEAF